MTRETPDLRLSDGTTLSLRRYPHGWELRHYPDEDSIVTLANWEDQPTWAQLQAAAETVMPPDSTAEPVDTEQTREAYLEGALRQAEDLLEERDAELREAGQDLMEARQKAATWEGLALEKDAHLEAVKGHLEDTRETLAGERARVERLERTLEDQRHPDGIVVNPHRTYLGPEGMWLPAGRVTMGPSGVINLEAEPRGGQPITPDPWAICGAISPSGLGGSLQPPRRCIRGASKADHRTVRARGEDRTLHTDGTYAWTYNGAVAGGGYTTTDV